MSAPEIKHHRSGEILLTEVFADPGQNGWYYRQKMVDSVARFIRSDALAASTEVQALIAAEREACAAMADEKAVGYEGENNEAAWLCSKPVAVRLRGLAAAIRERGTKP